MMKRRKVSCTRSEVWPVFMVRLNPARLRTLPAFWADQGAEYPSFQVAPCRCFKENGGALALEIAQVRAMLAITAQRCELGRERLCHMRRIGKRGIFMGFEPFR
ncbi:hypothetical protein [Sphingobium yanoikuyae]